MAMQSSGRTGEEPNEPAPRPGYEPNSLNMTFIWSTIVGLAVLTVFAMVLMGVFFRRLASMGERAEILPQSLRDYRSPMVEPSLDAKQRDHLREIRAAESEVLSSYRWIDEDQKVARIPIGRAMEILAVSGMTAPEPGEGEDAAQDPESVAPTEPPTSEQSQEAQPAADKDSQKTEPTGD